MSNPPGAAPSARKQKTGPPPQSNRQLQSSRVGNTQENSQVTSSKKSQKSSKKSSKKEMKNPTPPPAAPPPPPKVVSNRPTHGSNPAPPKSGDAAAKAPEKKPEEAKLEALKKQMEAKKAVEAAATKEKSKKSEKSGAKSKKSKSSKRSKKSMKGKSGKSKKNKSNKQQKKPEEKPKDEKKKDDFPEYVPIPLEPQNQPVTYECGHIDKEFMSIIERNPKTSLLNVSIHIVRFQIVEGIRCCYHVAIHNPTKEHIAFMVVRPPHAWLSATPKVGLLLPGEHRAIYLFFTARVQRLPDDLAFCYSIFQLPIPQKNLANVMQEKTNYNSRELRKFLKTKRLTNVWHIGIAFGEGGEQALWSNCDNVVHSLGKYPDLNDNGKIQIEQRYNPDEHDDKSEELPSAADN